MSLSRAVPQILSCHACNSALLRTFAASAGPNASNSLRASWTASRPLRRQFATTSIRREKKLDLLPADTVPGFEFLESPNSPSVAQTEPIPQTNETSGTDATKTATAEDTASPEADTLSAAPEATEDTSPVPWYLREQPVRPLNDPTELARSALPPLPENPPPLLPTLLEYISIVAGLDDLALYDLRHLDPPPALGSKLIMLIGTARSEKHLHVSADRFCRWLRREHGLKADAAGLLGRNELKIKLRRKAKRMKMLANVGGREEEAGNLDDGIRTGWICCTIGRMEAHPDDTHIPGVTDEENFVGFRDVKTGVNVVVQMFTEERRAEIDLETLWGGVLRTHERKDAVAEEQLRELGEKLDEDVKEEMAAKEREADEFLRAKALREASTPKPSGEKVAPQSWNKGAVFPPASSQASSQQMRRLHTVGLKATL